jgi:putative membrane protein
MKTNQKWIALTLALCLLFSLPGCSAAAANSSAQSGSESDSSAVEALEDTAVSLLTSGGHSSESGKEETVYVIADANGAAQDIIVENWVKNGAGSDTLTDRSTLSDIENTKGDEEFTRNADGTLTWAANGSDIYYEGHSDQALPVDVSVAYELDGQSVTAEALSGASGHVTITFSYDNHTAKQTEIDGEVRTIYQPYAMVSGLLLDGDCASNVTVTNGKVINDGDRYIVVGMAMPGLAESLDLDNFTLGDESLDLDIPEEVVVEADVTDFSLLTTLTVASGNALAELGLDDLGDLEDLKSQVAELTDGSGKLVDGTAEFSDYMGQLNTAAGTLQDGASTVDTYMNTLSGGLDTLRSAVADLPSGAGQLLAGTQALQQALKSGYTGTDSSQYGVYEALAAIAAGADQLSAAAGSIMTGADTVAAAADQIALGASSGSADPSQYGIYEAAAAVEAGLTAAQSQLAQGLASACANLDTANGYSQSALEVLQSLAASENLTDEQRAALTGAMQAVGASQQYVGGVSAALSGTSLDFSSATAALEGIQSGAQAIAAGAQAISAGVKSGHMESQDQYGIYEAAYAVQAGANQLGAAARQLMSAVDTMTNDENLGALISGLEQLTGQSGQLISAVDTLSSGASSLAEGTGTLSGGTGELSAAVAELFANSITLKDGMSELDSEGIQEIADLVNEDLEGLLHRIQAVQDYAEEEESFSGTADGVACTTRYIYKTAEIKN